MAWFRKKRPEERDFVSVAAEGFADLHTHIVFGVDDGSRTAEESVAMVDGLAALGFTRIAATPHFDMVRGTPSLETQSGALDTIRRLRGDKGPLLYTGAECVLDERFGPMESSGRIPGYGGEAAYLVELGFIPGSVPLGLENFVFQQQVAGKLLIAAHPERTPDLQRDKGRAEALRKAGMLFQLDVMSLTGRYGRAAMHAGFELLARDWVDLAATDIHRAADLPAVEKAMGRLWQEVPDRFARLFSTHPIAILEGAGDAIRAEDL